MSSKDPLGAVFSQVSKYLEEKSLRYTSVDNNRPWGGFFIINEEDTYRFIAAFFPDYPKDQIDQFGGKLSPKILIVGPDKRLSWQYHKRRAELWKAVNGPVGFINSRGDTQGAMRVLTENDTVHFDTLVRHRLVGLENWGVVAEIWQHTDKNNYSNEEDIVRLEDKYGRSV